MKISFMYGCRKKIHYKIVGVNICNPRNLLRKKIIHKIGCQKCFILWDGESITLLYLSSTKPSFLGSTRPQTATWAKRNQYGPLILRRMRRLVWNIVDGAALYCSLRIPLFSAVGLSTRMARIDDHAQFKTGTL